MPYCLSMTGTRSRFQYSRFIIYNVLGRAAWVLLFVFGGYFFGNIPIVKQNFSLVIFSIIFLSIHNVIITCAYSDIAAKAGIQKFKDWIPGQARNDNKEDKP